MSEGSLHDNRAEIEEALSEIVKVESVCNLPPVDARKLSNSKSHIDKADVERYNDYFGITKETIARSGLGETSFLLYTNSCLLPRNVLHRLLMEHIEQRKVRDARDAESQKTADEEEGEGEATDFERVGRPSDIVREHAEQYRRHRERILRRQKEEHLCRLKNNDRRLKTLLLPHRLSMSFLSECFDCCRRLATMEVTRRSLSHCRALSAEPLGERAAGGLPELLYMSEQRIHVPDVLKTIRDESLQMFLPPVYACLHENVSMTPVLDMYAKTDSDIRETTSPQLRSAWHTKMQRVLNMEEYQGYTRVHDIFLKMLRDGHNEVPVPRAQEHHVEDEARLRFWTCLLFVIYIHNRTTGALRLHLKRVDDVEECTAHKKTGTHLMCIPYGRIFCFGGRIYARVPDLPEDNELIESKCILSLFVHLSEAKQKGQNRRGADISN